MECFAFYKDFQRTNSKNWLLQHIKLNKKNKIFTSFSMITQFIA